MKKGVRLAVLAAVIAVNAVAFGALHLAMGDGAERSRTALVEPERVVVVGTRTEPDVATAHKRAPFALP
jgi:hypothetical protein